MKIKILYLLIFAMLLQMSFSSCSRYVPHTKKLIREQKKMNQNKLSYRKQLARQKRNELIRELPKQHKDFARSMRYFPGGEGSLGKSRVLKNRDVDTTLLLGQHYRKVHVDGFYMQEHETTIAEYKEFINWVIDSVTLALAARNHPQYYLDTVSKRLDWSKVPELMSFTNFDVFPSIGDFISRAISKDHRLLYQHTARRQVDTNENWIRIIRFRNNKRDLSLSLNSNYLKYTFELNGEIVTVPVLPVFDKQDWDNYFEFNFYQDHPVHNVTWQQANAYCHWKTGQIRNASGNKGTFANAVVRLPYEDEWEYAALSIPFRLYGNANFQFPWDDHRLRKKVPVPKYRRRNIHGNFFANFGDWYDENGYHLHASYIENVKYFKPNAAGLYDMGGNIAEWTLSSPDSVNYVQGLLNAFRKAQIDERSVDSILKITTIYHDDETNTAIEKIKTRQNFIRIFANEYELKNIFTGHPLDTVNSALLFAKQELHNAGVLYRNSPGRIVKGGSWLTPPVYILCSSREVFPENMYSNRVGFRIVLTTN